MKNKKKLATAKKLGIDAPKNEDMDSFLMICLKENGDQVNVGTIGVGTDLQYATMFHQFMAEHPDVLDALEPLVKLELLGALEDD